ncbi:modulator protein, partial [Pelomonas sp. HMWF004]
MPIPKHDGTSHDADASPDSSSLTDRRSLLRGAAGLSALALGSGLMGAESAQAAASATTSFTLAVLPDTQFYSRYATTDEGQQFQNHYGSTPYAAQTGWIAQNALAYNIPFVIHLGDVVDQQSKPTQWAVADAAMQQLENASVPYSILAGNHDVINDYDYHQPADQGSGTDAQRNLGAEPYLKWFPASRAARQTTFKERDSSGFHEYHLFQAHGVSFMVLSLSWRISDAGIAWARSVIARNPTVPVILANHQLLNIGNDGNSPLETDYGLMLWNQLIRDNDQIFMTLNGHHHGAAYLRKYNDFGNEVHQMVVDYQMDYQGGNAMMRLYEVDFTNNKIDVMSFSPWVVQKPKSTLNAFDFAELTQPNQRFSFPVNFKKRFAGFLRFKPTLSATGAPILPRVRSELLASYTEPTPVVATPPADSNDFPLVADTYAH